MGAHAIKDFENFFHDEPPDARALTNFGVALREKLQTSPMRRINSPSFSEADGFFTAMRLISRSRSSRNESLKITLYSIAPGVPESRLLNVPAPESHRPRRWLHPKRPGDGHHPHCTR